MELVRYPIRIVSKLTGLSADTLRAWERRYAAVVPSREDNVRMYTDADIERLNLLRQAIETGHSISKLANLDNDQLRELIKQMQTSIPVQAQEQVSEAGKVGLQQILDALEVFDYAKVDRELTRLVVLLTAREMVREVIVPIMRKVGENWESGQFRISQEHMLSAIIRNVLGTMLRLYSRQQAHSSILFATPTGEHHEFGILSAATLAASGGLGVIYLGTNLPADEIVEAATRSSVQVVVLGIVASQGAKESLKGLHQVCKKLPEKIEVWVGGPKNEVLIAEVKRSRALFLRDFNALEQQLIRLGASF